MTIDLAAYPRLQEILDAFAAAPERTLSRDELIAQVEGDIAGRNYFWMQAARDRVIRNVRRLCTKMKEQTGEAWLVYLPSEKAWRLNEPGVGFGSKGMTK